ncbi:hypothetical protein QBC38DRAFT_493173 [Podospora fimiseda]|uniref:Uncharacterized protein n=1 Tax=Podospora fimiseda TaxID=252190 RepID=A0AAN7BCN9_9PEZI|nr:hypothetical protein QBC38DRAFT_493173 [Podospora fimiseda]
MMRLTRDGSEAPSSTGSFADTPLSTSSFSFRFPSPAASSTNNTESYNALIPSIEFPDINSDSDHWLEGSPRASSHARNLSDFRENLGRLRVNSHSSASTNSTRRSISPSQFPFRPSTPPRSSRAGTESSVSQHLALTLRPDNNRRSTSTSTPTRSISPSRSPSQSRLSTPPGSSLGADALISQCQNLNLNPWETPSPGRGRRSPRARRSSSQVPQGVHKVSEEKSPDDPFHAPEFQKLFSDAKTLISRVSGVLGSRSLRHDETPELHRLCGRAQELASFECAATRTVAFVGDSGVGKSSVLNSLLDVKGLAPASSGGSACTSVATEYRFHDSETFTVEVTTFTEDEIRTRLSDLIAAYQLYETHKDNFDSDEEAEPAEEQFHLATDTFNAMFKGQMHDTEFITTDAEDEVLDTMMGWAREVAQCVGNQRHTFTDAEECSSLLTKLNSATGDADQPAPWPYMKKISVHLNAHVLRKGLILVDLPGLRDLNTARQKITERYLVECDEIFVVCQRSRATTDAGVKAVFQLAKQAGLTNVGIVCTKSDGENADEAKKEWKGRTRAEINRLVEEIETLQEELVELEEERKYFDELDDLDDAEKDELVRISRQVWAKRRLMEQINFTLDQYLVTIRNDWVTSELKKRYQVSTTAEVELQVHCVSNTHYWDHRHDPKDKAMPYLELSGIISLRRHCVSLVSQEKYRLVKRYLQGEIPGFLGEMELWIQAGTTSAQGEEKKLIREIVEEISSVLWENLGDNALLYEEMASTLTDKFQEHIINARRIPHWTSKAKQASEDWDSWLHQTYTPFCRNYGDHYTPVPGYRNWNEEAIKAMSDDLHDPWDHLQIALQTEIGDTRKKIHGVMTSGFNSIDKISQYRGVSDTLRRTLNARWRLLRSTLYDLQDDFTIAMHKLRTDALSGIRTSIFGQSMEDTYRRCNRECGGGSDKRRKRIMALTLGSQDIFHTQIREMRWRFGALVDDLENKVEEAVDEQLREIDQVLNIVRNENAVAECDVDVEFLERVKGVVEEVALEMRRIGVGN